MPLFIVPGFGENAQYIFLGIQVVHGLIDALALGLLIGAVFVKQRQNAKPKLPQV